MLTWIEIDKNAIIHNLSEIKSKIGDALLMPVIKANGYGHGLIEMAKICQKCKGVAIICVANDQEAVQILKTIDKITKKILILSFFEFNKTVIHYLAKKSVLFPVYNLEQASFLNKVGEGMTKKINIHLKIDTGAHRLGLMPECVNQFINNLSKYKFLNLEGVFSHFASSEDDKKYTLAQIKKFQSLVATVERITKKNNLIKHISCSASTILFPDNQCNAYRVGIAIYGLYSSKLLNKYIRLKPVLSWKTSIICIKDVPAGAKIGYGGTLTTSKKSKIATIPVGYWDGYDRSLSNTSSVIIRGFKCPVVGRICMNLTMVDVTKVKHLNISDKVVLIGNSGKNRVTAEDLAKWSDTINYEVIDRINPQIKRIYI